MEDCGEEEQHKGRWARGGVRNLWAKAMKLLFMENQRERTEKEVGEKWEKTLEGAKDGLWIRQGQPKVD